MKLIEKNTILPLDILRFINRWVKNKQLNNENIKEAINLWMRKNEECLWKYGPISDWNTSQVTNMSYLFTGCSFNEDISHWDVSKVTYMNGMFAVARLFNGDISHWNVGQVKDMSYMFAGASSFNGDIRNWNVSKVTTTSCMFIGATLFNQVRYSPRFPTIE